VQTRQIHVSDGRHRVHEIRTELFAFPEVLDVFVTGRPDALVVVYWGRPRPGNWLRALRAVGFHVPARQRAAAVAPKFDAVEASHSEPRPGPKTTASRRAGVGRRRLVRRRSPPAIETDRAPMAVLLLLIWCLFRQVIAQVARLIARRRRKAHAGRVSGGRHGDSSLHSRRAAAEAEVEDTDIDEMLDAIAELRRRNGHRAIGEELADELMRSTWDD
jgi:hypothetical protein